MTHPDPGRLHVAHRYIAAATGAGAREQGRHLEALASAYGEAVLLPNQRRLRPLRTRDTDARLRKIQRQLKGAILSAHIAAACVFERYPNMTLHRAAQDIALVLADGKQRRGLTGRAWSANTRGTEVVRNIWRPHVATVHLAIPLALAKHPKRADIAQRRPELVALAAPDNFVDLVLDDRWPLQALEVAAMWRQLLIAKGLVPR